MSHDYRALVSQFKEILTQQRYHPVVVHNYFVGGVDLQNLAPIENEITQAALNRMTTADQPPSQSTTKPLQSI
ncbi:MAG: hypothetical protein ACR2JB_11720 [Bryobacteraceae bacterium]